ncbi:MAG: TPM domain-containing protein [Chthoniobacterales bacterium]
MNRTPLLVRLGAGALLLGRVLAQDLPPRPAHYLYDPDFLLSKDATEKLSSALKKFKTTQGITVYLALFTKTPRPIEETSQDLNQAWNQSGLGVVITFAPRAREARVVSSPQLSLRAQPDALTAIFLEGAKRGLERGDDSIAAGEGTGAVMKELHDLRAQMAGAAPETKSWRPGRAWLLAGLGVGGLGGLAFLWLAARAWQQANLFGNSYRFRVVTTPVPERFGAKRCGGLMATLEWRKTGGRGIRQD